VLESSARIMIPAPLKSVLTISAVTNQSLAKTMTYVHQIGARMDDVFTARLRVAIQVLHFGNRFDFTIRVTFYLKANVVQSPVAMSANHLPVALG